MEQQTQACHAVLEALKNDTGKRKKVDYWKKYACQSIGIKKMGNARWNLLLEHGEKLGLFHRDYNALPSKTILVEGSKNQPSIMDLKIEAELLDNVLEGGDALDVASAYALDTKKKTKKKTKTEVASEPVEEEAKPQRNESGFLPSDYIAGTGILKTKTTRPKNIKSHVISEGTYVPKKGDIFWAKCVDGSVKQVEVDEVHVCVNAIPLSKKDGHWTVISPDHLFDTKKQATQFDQKEQNKKYWSLDAMDKSSYALFKEYEENRELFLKWKSQQNQASEEELDDFLKTL